MANLNIRNLPDHIHARLRVRAAEAGRSMEAEAREILTAACLQDEEKTPAASLQQLVDKLYRRRKPNGVAQALIEERRREAERE